MVVVMINKTHHIPQQVARFVVVVVVVVVDRSLVRPRVKAKDPISLQQPLFVPTKKGNPKNGSGGCSNDK